jgi:preprotein translocase subunit SecA
MMSAIREDAVGFLYNLEVEVSGGKGTAQVTAKGLNAPEAPQNLSYIAPSADGEVEVRNQRGQVMQASTDAARQSAPQVSAAFGGPATPANRVPTGQARQGQGQAPKGQGSKGQGSQGQGGQQSTTGAFGQKQAAPAAGPAAANRAQRRAQGKKKSS